MKRLISPMLVIALAITAQAPADTVTLTLDSSEIGTHLSEGTRVPSNTTSGTAQYNRSEVFTGYSSNSTLLSLRSVFGFDLTSLSEGAIIHDVSLDFTYHDVDNGTVSGVELYLSANQNIVESTFDFDTYGVDGPTGFNRGTSDGLGILLSSNNTAYAANTSGTVVMTDTTGNFTSAFTDAYTNGAGFFNVILTSLTTEANQTDALLRIWSDDQGNASVRPHLIIDYTPIREIEASKFYNETLLDFEAWATGNLDASADNPTTNALLTSNGIASIFATAATNQSDEQNQNSINGKGLYYVGGTDPFVDGDEGRFAILDQDNADGLSELSEFRMDGGPTYDISFIDKHDQFGVTFIDQAAQTMTFTFWADGVEIASYDLAVALTTTTAGNELYALETPFLFDRVVISGSDADDGWGLGEIRFGTVPEPASMTMLGIAALALSRRRFARK